MKKYIKSSFTSVVPWIHTNIFFLTFFHIIEITLKSLKNISCQIEQHHTCSTLKQPLVIGIGISYMVIQLLQTPLK